MLAIMAENKLHPLIEIIQQIGSLSQIARNRSRTCTPLRARDFKSLVSTIPPSEQATKFITMMEHLKKSKKKGS